MPNGLRRKLGSSAMPTTPCRETDASARAADSPWSARPSTSSDWIRNGATSALKPGTPSVSQTRTPTIRAVPPRSDVRDQRALVVGAVRIGATSPASCRD
jgi:hypothetical protein